jgi:hypothetical protein
VTAFRTGIARQLSEIDGYYYGQSTGNEGKEECNKDRIEELSDKGEVGEEGQVDSSAEEEEGSETEEQRDARLHEDERENWSADPSIQAGSDFVDERGKRTDKVTWADDMRARSVEEVPEVWRSTTNQEN